MPAFVNLWPTGFKWGTKEDYCGNFTHYNKTKGASSVSLAIISSKIFENVKRFMVQPQLDISDYWKIVTQIDNINQTYLPKPEEQEITK